MEISLDLQLLRLFIWIIVKDSSEREEHEAIMILMIVSCLSFSMIL